MQKEGKMGHIKGFDTRITAGWPRIGKLRKGGPKRKKTAANGETYEVFGEDLKWFRFVTERQDVAEAFRAAYGAEPPEFEVYLPYTSVDANFRYGRAYYRAGGLEFECDGENMILWRGDDGKMHAEPKPCPYCSGQVERTRKDPGCQQYGILTVFMPKLLEAGYVGPVEIETHSWNDMRSILASLQQTMDMRGGNPMGLRGILFHVYRVPEKVSTPMAEDNRKKRARREKWLVKIEPAAIWVRAQLQAAYEASLLPDAYDARRFERQALLGAERRAAEVLTPAGYVNMAHMAGDPERELTPEELAREAELRRQDDSFVIEGHSRRPAIPVQITTRGRLWAGEARGGPEEPEDLPADKPDTEVLPEPDPKPEPAAALEPEHDASQVWDKATLRKFDARAHFLFERAKAKFSSREIKFALGCAPEACTMPYEQAVASLEGYLNNQGRPRSQEAA